MAFVEKWKRVNSGGKDFLVDCEDNSNRIELSMNLSRSNDIVIKHFGRMTGKQGHSPQGRILYERESGVWELEDWVGKVQTLFVDDSL